jgi:hypothetical protein
MDHEFFHLGNRKVKRELFFFLISKSKENFGKYGGYMCAYKNINTNTHTHTFVCVLCACIY